MEWAKDIVLFISLFAIFSSKTTYLVSGSEDVEYNRPFVLEDSNGWWQLAKQFSLYESEGSVSYDTNGYDHLYEDAPMFNEVDLLKYRDIFKFVPDLTNSPIGDILQHGPIPSEATFQDGLSFTMLLSELVNSNEMNTFLRAKLVSLFSTILTTGYKGESIIAMDTDPSVEDLDRFDDLEDMEQVGGWEGCRRDYNALALPWTNNILQRIAKSVIGREFPEGEVDCSEACDSVCQNFTDLRNCTTVCTELCWQLEATNATYDEVVDFIVNILFPRKAKMPWHRAIFDAMAKVPPAIVHGNLHWVGGYDRCVSVHVNHTYREENRTGQDIIENRQFNGQYYRIPLKPPFLQNRSLQILYGACLPSTCSKEDVVKYITEENDLFELLKNTLKWEINEELMFNGTHVQDDPKSAGLIILIVILVFTIFLMVLPATIYDIFFREMVMKKHVEKINRSRLAHRKRLMSEMSCDSSVDGNKEDSNSGSHQRPVLFHSISTQSTASLVETYSPTEVESGTITIWDRLEVLFVAFSGYSNFIRIFRVRYLETDLPALDCVRFVSYGWAIMGFTWLLGPFTGSVWLSANVFHALRTFIPSWQYQAVINFHFASDSFYVISGILVAYWWLIEHDGKPRTVIGWVKTALLFYLKKYWKVAPALMFVVLFYFTTYKVFTGGPFSSVQIGDAENCRVNWWTNLLMINNLVNTDKSCVTWNWYISTWFQLLIMCPLVLIPLVIKPLLGYISLLAVYIIHLAITAGIIGSLTGDDNFSLRNWASDYFVTPWCRAGPFFIGMAYGIVLQKNQKKLNIPKWSALLGFLLSVGLILTVTYGTYGQFKEGGERWGRDAQVMYHTFARSVYGLGLGFIILMCCTGNGGFIGEVMNWRGFQPLSRMTFCAFLFSSPLIYTQAYGRRDALWITGKSITHMFLSNMVSTFVVGMAVTGPCFHYSYSLGVERAFFKVRTKEDCIKAGRHPDIIPLVPLADSKETNKLAGVSELYNSYQKEDGMAKDNFGYVGFNRQDSITSM